MKKKKNILLISAAVSWLFFSIFSSGTIVHGEDTTPTPSPSPSSTPSASPTATAQPEASPTATVVPEPTPAPAVQSVSMYRLYNPNSGEHFYTKDDNERKSLVLAGWNMEGIGWTSPITSNTPVYRVYNPNAGDHHYTVNWNEKANLVGNGWTDEGVGWYSDDAKTVAVYRQYNPNAKAGSHNYTVNANERDMLIGAGWSDENIGWYATGGAQQYIPPENEKVSADLRWLMSNYLSSHGIDPASISIYIHDFAADGSCALNGDAYFAAASTYKLPLAVYYYEMLNAGQCDINAVIHSDPDDYYGYTEGTIGEMLNRAIVNSDNAAAHALYNNLGGWMEFKKDVVKYSGSIVSPERYYSYDNVFTAGYMNDLLNYIYKNRGSFGILINDMLASEPGNYLNRVIGDVMAQKCGCFDGAINAVGFAYYSHPYSIAVFTDNVSDAAQVIGELNEICWNYFN